MAGPEVKAPADYLSMSDEDFKNLSSPVAVPSLGSNEEEAKPEDDSTEGASQEEESNEEDSSAEADGDTASEEDASTDENADADESKSESGDEDKDKSDADSAGETGADGAEGAGSTSEEPAPKAQDKKAKPVVEVADDQPKSFEVPTSFKANGKIVTLKDAEEAKSLMQMGANYTRRMQELAPYRKTLTMLEKHNLLDQDKLSFLIDLHEKNPEAIKKLVKDSGIDTLDLDTDTEQEYTPTDRSVSDNEMGFRTVLEDIVSQENGRETVTVIQNTWDEQSKTALMQNPDLLSIFHEQRALGIYDQITDEIDRLTSLGKIPAGTPFIQAYKTAGDALAAEGAFDNLNGSEESDAPTTSSKTTQTGQSGSARKVVTTRAAVPKSQVANGDKATAAAPTKTAGGLKNQEKVNPLSLSDEEFLRIKQLRV